MGWSIHNKSADFDKLAACYGISSITARLLVNRGLLAEKELDEYLYPGEKSFHSPLLLKNMDRAAEMVCERISGGHKIRVVGDYDVDGIMSSYILLDALRGLGADVDCYIPDRVKDGYGINAGIVDEAYEQGVDTIITCDNGISALEAAARAGELGMMLIVTDHHEVPEVLPCADIIVNAKQSGDAYPCRNICGAVVAAKLAEAVYGCAGKAYSKDRYIEYMAIATICDVVELTGENRAIAKLGIRALKGTQNMGLRALIEECSLADIDINEYHIGYVIGPCFNATGRLDVAQTALKLLLASDSAAAKELAGECRMINEERKRLTVNQEELAYMKYEAEESGSTVVVIVLEDCHESLLGIIAGRLRERCGKPVFVLTKSGELMKGSGRSIPAYNMFEGLNRCADLMEKYGGHPMAAGLSIRPENVEILRKRLNSDSSLTTADLEEKILLDAEVSFNLFSEEIVNEMGLLEPFGPGNERPLFAERGLRLKQLRYMGKNSNYLRMLLVNTYGHEISAVYFRNAADLVDRLQKSFGEAAVRRAFSATDSGITLTVAYVPQINEYLGMKTLQMNIKAVKI